MAKRFTDTEKWNDPWHRKELTPVYKCFWDYINAKCDRSGVWKVDMDQASFFINSPVDPIEALRIFGAKRIKILNPEYWQILGFISFQYGHLSEACKSHKDVFSLMEFHRVSKGYSKGIHTLKDKDKDKDKEKEGEGMGGVTETKRHEWFEKLWLEFPQKGRVGKKGALRHFLTSVKDVVSAKACAVALEKYLGSKRVKEGFIQNGSTWFNDWQSWENYVEEKDGTVNC